MAHIQLNNDFPGIVGLLHYSPETAKPLNDLAEILLYLTGMIVIFVIALTEPWLQTC